MRRLAAVGVAVLFMVSGSALGRGLLIPKDGTVPPLAIKSHRVTVEVQSQLAVTKVEQVFENSTSRDLEATYIFPLPPGATVNDFAMYMNGVRTSGELVEKEKARQVYTEIVRRMRDPGLLEYMGGNLLRMNIYPVPARGRMKLEVQYSEVLGRDSGMHKYVYPLKTEEPASRTMEDFTFSVHVVSKEAITNVYSPTHKIGVTRKGDYEATVGFEEDKAALDRDVVLYYTVSETAFGMNLMTHKPAKGEDGYFLLLITPKTQFPESEILPRDVCFVLDTSGSMQEDGKLVQAKAALKHCVGSLSGKDRFTVIAFSTGVNPMSQELVKADEAGKKQATAFIDAQQAAGGTAIYAALEQALAVKRDGDKGRSYLVVFLTDGRPTVGEDNTEAIVKSVAWDSDRAVRIFTWGVGDDVNTHLLDRIAEATRAVSEYVAPREEMEQKVSLFFNKLSKPVMSGCEIDWGKMKVHDVYPARIPDLFAGQQVSIFGRYSGTGDAAVALAGTVGERKEKQTFEGTFGPDAGNSFVEKLWASRHVGFLLDEIRLRGEKAELKEEVIRLSRTYGIQTPYTSYLVLESKDAYAQHGLTVGGPPYMTGQAGAGPATAGGLRKDLEEARRQAAATAPADAATPVEMAEADAKKTEGAKGDADVTAREKLKSVSGEDAVDLALKLRGMKEATTGRNEAGSVVKRVGERSFYFYRGFWVDGQFTDTLPALNVKYLSEAYFELVDKLPQLREVLALGERVIVVVNGTAVIVEDQGKEKLTEEELGKLLGK